MEKKSARYIFWGTLVASLVLYVFTQSPVKTPESWKAAHGFWAYWLDVFGGSAGGMSATFAAVGVSVLAWTVARYLGWRIGLAVAIATVFLPGVWELATRGNYRALYFGWIMIGLAVFEGVVRLVFAKARKVQKAEELGTSAPSKFAKGKRIAGNCFIGIAAVYAVWSVTSHEYRYGRAEQVYEADILSAANGRWIAAVERDDEAARTALVERVKAEFPEDKELATVAQIGCAAFFDAAVRKYPDKFYLKLVGDAAKDGSAALEKWNGRWEHVKGFLDARDPFIPQMRRRFAYEGNAIGNQLQEEGKQDEAWALYYRIFSEIEPGNIAAAVNMSEMMRRNYEPHKSEQLKVRKVLDDFFKDKRKSAHFQEIVRSSGLVRADKDVIAKMKADMEKRIEEMKKNHEPLPVSPEFKQLVEWNNDMIKAMDARDIGKAGRIARTILSNPKWRGFIPANAILGTIVAQEGDLDASEAFFRVATATTNEIPTIVMNDFADTLRLQGKLEEAETWARRCVKESGDKNWVAKVTLAEVLIDAGKDQKEINDLLAAAKKAAPKNVPEVRKLFDGLSRRMHKDKSKE